MDDYSVPSLSPSFSTYSDNRISEIADRVTQTFSDSNEYNDEFEFAILQTPATSSSSSSSGLVFPVFDRNLIAVESEPVFDRNLIAVESKPVLDRNLIAVESKPVFDRNLIAVESKPVFDRNLFAVESKPVLDRNLIEPVLTPLSDLFRRERNDPPPEQNYSSSSSSDEEDELDDIPSEIYCPWTPVRSTAEMSPSGGCRKSKSTGSSYTSSWSTKRWRIGDLLKRSRSDGKQSLTFLNNKETKKKERVCAHEKFYLRNKAIKEEDKRKSYLPYKQDLFGLFTNINRSFPHF